MSEGLCDHLGWWGVGGGGGTDKGRTLRRRMEHFPDIFFAQPWALFDFLLQLKQRSPSRGR